MSRFGKTKKEKKKINNNLFCDPSASKHYTHCNATTTKKKKEKKKLHSTDETREVNTMAAVQVTHAQINNFVGKRETRKRLRTLDNKSHRKLEEPDHGIILQHLPSATSDVVSASLIA